MAWEEFFRRQSAGMPGRILRVYVYNRPLLWRRMFVRNISFNYLKCRLPNADSVNSSYFFPEEGTANRNSFFTGSKLTCETTVMQFSSQILSCSTLFHWWIIRSTSRYFFSSLFSQWNKQLILSPQSTRTWVSPQNSQDFLTEPYFVFCKQGEVSWDRSHKDASRNKQPDSNLSIAFIHTT